MDADPRDVVLLLLETYDRVFGDEAATVDRVRSLVRSRNDCLWRTCFVPGHVTASAWVCSEDGSRAVLLHHGKLDKWLQPGGHVDGQAELWHAAEREVAEETGLPQLSLHRHQGFLVPLDIDVHVIPARRDEPAHEHHDVRFLLIATGDAPLTVSEESHAVRWIEVDDIARYTGEESVLRLARKARAWLA